MERSPKVRVALTVVAVIRLMIGVLAIPLAPFLYENHFIALVLMRPTKEVLLAAGFLIRLGEVWWVPVLAAAVPLAIGGVWQFYFLGRQYAPQLRSGRNMPWLLKRVLKPDRVKAMQRLLERKGMRLVVLGRLAVFPSSVVAAAAGSGDIKSRRFLTADGIGGLLSIVEVMGAGYVLGYAYKQAGPWISAAGFVAVVVIGVITARSLRREEKRSKRGRSKRKGSSGPRTKRRSAGRGRRAAATTSRS